MIKQHIINSIKIPKGNILKPKDTNSLQLSENNNWWCDCDPGKDDCIALLMSFRNNYNFNLVAVSSSKGNVSLIASTHNIVRIMEIAFTSHSHPEMHL